jgi:hypothetical protein
MTALPSDFKLCEKMALNFSPRNSECTQTMDFKPPRYVLGKKKPNVDLARKAISDVPCPFL